MLICPLSRRTSAVVGVGRGLDNEPEALLRGYLLLRLAPVLDILALGAPGMVSNGAGMYIASSRSRMSLPAVICLSCQATSAHRVRGRRNDDLHHCNRMKLKAVSERNANAKVARIISEMDRLIR